ncbi:MAG: hypothetical protein LBD17_00810 [Endomicrobium sp.]|nr:hypothetical protein [Endomicrobium sp.]
MPEELKPHCKKCGTIVTRKHELCRKCSQLGVKKVSEESIQKRRKTLLERYGNEKWINREKIKQTCLERYGVEHSFQSDNNKSKSRKTMQEKYGVEYPAQSKELIEKQKLTCKEKYGVKWSFQSENNKEKTKQTKEEKYGDKNWNNREKAAITCQEKYGVNNPGKAGAIKLSETLSTKDLEFFRNRAIKASHFSIINGLTADSEWEENFIKSHPDCKRGPCVEYEYNNKIHHWNIDFEWRDKLYEIKNPFYFDLNFSQWHPELTWAKWKKGETLDVRWYLWNPLDMTRKFPIEDPLELFRNKCWVGKNKSPWEAWTNYDLRFRAEENFAKQLGFGGNLLKKTLSGRYSINNLILERFTIAKIAPRVTSMSKSEAKKWLLASGFDLSKGVYDPCGGFNGRKEACIELGIKYESYDVNPDLIRLVGHSYRDLITMDPVTTDKIVFTSPPWNDKECWPGSNGSITEIHEKEWWYELIQRKVRAPHYILVNGAENESGRLSGLFGQRNKKVLYV